METVQIDGRRAHAGASLISPGYRALQSQLHELPEYGTASVHWAPLVAEYANQLKPSSILDYGAGKGRLAGALTPLLDFTPTYALYDPAIPAISDAPARHPMVACIDVLEHIEPACLDAVLDDLARVTGELGLFTVATSPAVKTLADGRNAHLIQEGPAWWMPKFFTRFSVKIFTDLGPSFWVLVTPRSH